MEPLTGLYTRVGFQPRNYGRSHLTDSAGNSYCRGRPNTVDLLIKVGCFVKKVDNIFSVKNS
jgi:hypothetical protein